jgi:hypothetical protein
MRIAVAGLLLGLTLAALPAAAEEMAVFSLVMKDGTITPSRLEVPANRAFKIEISNTGKVPAELESLELHKEKVLAAGSASSLVFRRLEPGEYEFFDDFHPQARVVLVAR